MDPTARQIWLGMLLITASSVVFSTAGLFTRLIDLDAWTMLFWRGLFAGLFIAGFLFWREGRGAIAALRAIGRDGVLVTVCSALATVCFINALKLTSVADVLVIGATAPFLTAALAWAFIGEREDLVTLLASLVAVLGVVVMVGAALEEGRLLGDLLALGMTGFLSLMMVILRKRRSIDMVPATGLSAFLCALIVLPFAHPVAVDGMNFVLLVLFGSVQFGLGLLLLTLGSRLISATRTALISVLDTPLAPLWVWLAFGEVPAAATLAGGAIVMVAVVGDMLLPRRHLLLTRGAWG
ncbi:MAG: DMT family transporter [Reyranella sp.]|uniref:DMT family transporter n=1 Tax=Reyranella sp. TaxID=1929291 RepID=UPI0012146F54|nr:DMT family transporter [Reyranella sp.]TAJ41815.1 MAG: DMT family transporter [Reyranella sp.]